MPEPNNLLRQARLRTPSPSGSGRHLSRQELADLVNAYLFNQTGRSHTLDANYIGKLERGQFRWPQISYREACRAVFDVATDGELGFYVTRRQADMPIDVNRKEFSRQSSVATAGLLASLPVFDVAPAVSRPRPSKVGRTDVEQVNAMTQVFASWDNAHGGGLAREAVYAQLRWSARLLKAACPDKLREELFAAVGGLAGVAGFIAFDAFAHDEARRVFRFALECAESSGDWQLRAMLLSDMARQEMWCGDPDTGLTHVELALVRPDRLTPTERAMLHTVRARALAKLGRHRAQDALKAVGAADEEFAKSVSLNAPPWMAFYDEAQHNGDTAHALFDMAVVGHRTEAGARFAYAVKNHSSEFARSRAISQTKLASLTMATGDPRRATVFGHCALDAVGALKSLRAAADLRELYRYASRHTAISEVVELRDRIATTLAAA